MVLNEQIGIAQINDDAVLLKDNTLAAVLKIDPIKFDALNSKKKSRVENLYKKWLDSLTYPVQIVSRKANIDVKEQAKVIKNRVEYTIKQKEEHRDLLKLYKEFEAWLDEYLSKNSGEAVIYYLVIPVFSSAKLTKGLIKVKTNERYDEELKKLNARVENAIEKLKPTGIGITRLDNDALKNLYKSYFEVTLFSEKYNGPGEWIELWRTSDDFQKRQQD